MSDVCAEKLKRGKVVKVVKKPRGEKSKTIRWGIPHATGIKTKKRVQGKKDRTEAHVPSTWPEHAFGAKK